jgi:hypothetical protein
MGISHRKSSKSSKKPANTLSVGKLKRLTKKPGRSKMVILFGCEAASEPTCARSSATARFASWPRFHGVGLALGRGAPECVRSASHLSGLPDHNQGVTCLTGLRR